MHPPPLSWNAQTGSNVPVSRGRGSTVEVSSSSVNVVGGEEVSYRELEQHFASVMSRRGKEVSEVALLGHRG